MVFCHLILSHSPLSYDWVKTKIGGNVDGKMSFRPARDHFDFCLLSAKSSCARGGNRRSYDHGYGLLHRWTITGSLTFLSLKHQPNIYTRRSNSIEIRAKVGWTRRVAQGAFEYACRKS